MSAIFEPFKRIADDDTAPEGSGIGLALVKKTVEWCRRRDRGAVGSGKRSAARPSACYWPKRISA